MAAGTKGTISQVIGSTFDAQFPEDALPEIYNAIDIAWTQDGEDKTLVGEVQQHLGGGRVRAVALGSTDGLKRGMPITVTQLAGKHHYFVVKPDDTVEILKQLITKRTEIVGETQALRVAGAPTMLRDDLTLAGAGIVPSGRTSWSTTSCRWRPGFQYAIHCSAFPAAAAASSPACSAASHGAGSSVSRLRSPLGFRRSPYTTSGCSVCVVAQRSYAAAIGSGDAPRAVKKACAKSERLASSAAVIGTDCDSIGDKSTCDSSGCSWCTAGAVPDSCKTMDEARQLPPAVFDCDNLA